ncbi:MAG: SUMF1/EgtB/PvdO family nonheme iron enzyme [Myxococcota bacterium]
MAQRLAVIGDARLEGDAAAVVRLVAELGAWVGAAAGLDADGVWLQLEVGGAAHRLRWLPAGAFVMGEPGREVPHGVLLSRGLWLGEAPVSEAFYGAVLGAGGGGDAPVTDVSWDEAAAWCERLAARFPALAARLPTEAEWEYAARGGFALRGLLGGVQEWCADRGRCRSQRSRRGPCGTRWGSRGRAGWSAAGSGPRRGGCGGPRSERGTSGSASPAERAERYPSSSTPSSTGCRRYRRRSRR